MIVGTQNLSDITKEQRMDQSKSVFIQLYKDILIKKCRIKVQEIRDKGTYVSEIYGHPAFDKDSRNLYLL